MQAAEGGGKDNPILALPACFESDHATDGLGRDPAAGVRVESAEAIAAPVEDPRGAGPRATDEGRGAKAQRNRGAAGLDESPLLIEAPWRGSRRRAIEPPRAVLGLHDQLCAAAESRGTREAAQVARTPLVESRERAGPRQDHRAHALH
ncbi:MAG: hypothetical protein O2816_12745, partial [Planctomycetota bacterium]|nr:hypothetical protein [Planctomycetota bacterium]